MSKQRTPIFKSPLYEEDSLMTNPRITGPMWAVPRQTHKGLPLLSGHGDHWCAGVRWMGRAASRALHGFPKQQLEKQFLWSISFCPVFVFAGCLLCLVKRRHFPSQVPQPWLKRCGGGRSLALQLRSDPLGK